MVLGNYRVYTNFVQHHNIGNTILKINIHGKYITKLDEFNQHVLSGLKSDFYLCQSLMIKINYNTFNFISCLFAFSFL